MDGEALRTFLAIHRSGGFSSAASLLHRSQPAISRRIALLEEELGAPLFERGAALQLSAAGRTLLPHAERIVAALHDAQAAIASLHSEVAGSLALAAVGTLAGTRLTAILQGFVTGHPKVHLSIRTATSAQVSDLVRRGEATIGLRYLLDPAPDLACEHIASETLRVACAPTHRLAGREVKSLAQLHGEHWFAFPNTFEQRETFAGNVFAQFQARGFAAVNWTPVDSLTAQKRLVEVGFGLALLSENAMEDELARKSIATIEVRDLQAAEPVYAVVRKDGYLTPAAQQMLALLRSQPDLAGKSRTASARRAGRAKRTGR
jgi:DNA-binding transcriptional LysR family regulator